MACCKKVVPKEVMKEIKKERIVEYKEEVSLAKTATKLGMKKANKVKQPQKH